MLQKWYYQADRWVVPVVFIVAIPIFSIVMPVFFVLMLLDCQHLKICALDLEPMNEDPVLQSAMLDWRAGSVLHNAICCIVLPLIVLYGGILVLADILYSRNRSDLIW